MSFWSCKVVEGSPHAVAKGSTGKMLHITGAMLTKSSKPGKSYLMLTKGVNTFTVGMLKKDRAEGLRLDLFVTEEENVRLSVSGPAEVQLIGSFEKCALVWCLV
eukprot:TRINITY_DN10396_c0_g1_i1.p1 TRINITY_DN10396_c0_g1~~TRINITY_DN10396_c0_g1_i1.p1  ORF type:complete len:104 (+),score=17.35 TRINITY_DN10396_c0_g1_i1:187-498(+)